MAHLSNSNLSDLSMNITKNWKIMNWNIRGVNSDKKWDALSNKIEESGCDIVCLQETKREHFDLKYIKNFCPKKFKKFVFLPSVGASGGIILSGMMLYSLGSSFFRMTSLF
jgi:exonuclease III